MASAPRILGVIDEDPFHPATWSGISYYFFGALRRTGCLYTAISSECSPWRRLLYKSRSFHPQLSKWRFKYHINTAYYACLTNTALRRVSRLPRNEYDTILQIGAWYDLTRVSGIPVVSYHDGNLAGLLNSPYGYPDVGARYIARALAHERRLYHALHHIFPMSRWLAGSFMKDFGVPSSKLTPVGAGINLPRVRPIVGKTYAEAKILFVGRDFRRKGGEYLLEAFQIVRREIPKATLTIVGPTLPSAPEGVRCTGPVSKTEQAGIERLLEEYGSATIFVMPSLYEPFGIVFAEAMAHKLPCIGTDICAIPEIIEDGRTGYIVPPKDSVRLAARMVSLLKDSAQCRAFGENGHAKYLTEFTWDVVARKIVSQLRQG